MTGWGSIDTAVEAMRRGARSFVQKPWDDTTLVEVVRARNRRRPRRRAAAMRRQAREQEEARLIQRALLPSTMPADRRLHDRRALDAGRRASAATASTCCASRTRASRVSIADVVGKGLPAALLMSNLQAAVRAFATAQAEPHDVCAQRQPPALPQHRVRQVRDVLLRGRRHRTARRSSYANAGHNPAAARPRATARSNGSRTTGLVLGVSPDWTYYERRRSPLGAGDRLVCFTDGITEALSPDGEEFGDDRLVDLIRANRTVSADALAHDPRRHAGGLDRRLRPGRRHAHRRRDRLARVR